jgi:hypothetical protein
MSEHFLCFAMQVGRLRQWQQELPPPKQQQQRKASAAAAGSQLLPSLRGLLPANTQLLPTEYGASLDVQLTEGPEALRWFLGQPNGSSSRGQKQQQHHGRSAAVDAAEAATPAELRQLFAAEAAGDDLGWGDGSAAGAAGDDGGGLDVDIDSDDERKGRGKKVCDWLAGWACCYCLCLHTAALPS